MEQVVIIFGMADESIRVSWKLIMSTEDISAPYNCTVPKLEEEMAFDFTLSSATKKRSTKPLAWYKPVGVLVLVCPGCVLVMWAMGRMANNDETRANELRLASFWCVGF